MIANLLIFRFQKLTNQRLHHVVKHAKLKASRDEKHALKTAIIVDVQINQTREPGWE
jgi:hypothetical protein